MDLSATSTLVHYFREVIQSINFFGFGKAHRSQNNVTNKLPKFARLLYAPCFYFSRSFPNCISSALLVDSAGLI